MGYVLVAEGGANKLFRTPSNDLIRVSKRGVRPTDVAAYWNDFWRPKLGAYMGQMIPVEDPLYGRALRIDEIGKGSSQIVAEFKPKWLHQSPAAPRAAVACRTCAIKTMRKQELSWCSLDLAAKDYGGVKLCMQHAALGSHVEQCTQLLLSIDLLDQLAHWQAELLIEKRLFDLMSLRDCTVLIEHAPDSGYACWIVDLDPKDEGNKREEKLAKWARLEDELQPYYTLESHVCRLSR